MRLQRMIWLSFPLGLGDPRPPAIPAPRLEPLYTVEKDGACVHILTVASHTGTHVDTPRHVIEGGFTIHDFSLAELTYHTPTVVDVSLGDDAVVRPVDLLPHKDAMGGADLVLLRFGYGAVRRNQPDRYSLHCPGLGVEAADWMVHNLPEMRALGLDVPSLASIPYLSETMASHNSLLGGGRRMIVIEDMNLEQDLSRLVSVIVQPWLVTGMDSAPCSIIGVME